MNISETKIVKQSFLSNIFRQGRGYEDWKENALFGVAVGTLIIGVFLGVSCLGYFEFVSKWMGALTGTSLPFLLYIWGVVILLDIEVDIDETDFQEIPYVKRRWRDMFKYRIRFIKYQLSMIWGVLLIAVAVAAVYYSKKYYEYYSFQCGTFLIDEDKGVYHYSSNWDCEKIGDDDDIYEIRGYEMPQDYELCEYCESWKYDMEMAEQELYIKKDM